MKKTLIGIFFLVTAAQLGACGGSTKDEEAYCCINKQYYTCSDQGAQQCVESLGSNTSGCSRNSAKDSSCK